MVRLTRVFICSILYVQSNTGECNEKAINIRLEESLLHNLDTYAREIDRTRTYIIEKAVGAYFDRLDEMIADKRIDEIKSGTGGVMTLEQVAMELGLQ